MCIPHFVFPFVSGVRGFLETFWLLGIMLRTQVYKYLFEFLNIFEEHFLLMRNVFLI